ncbi:MAG: ABC-F family ATP-binding cassette domain-containing protein [Luteibaculaceae bacterium]
MNILSVEQISKSYGARVLFTDLSFGISMGEKVGLIAPNGSGKSTLFNILSSADSADKGLVVYKNDIVICFVEQDEKFDPEKTIKEVVFSTNSPAIEAIKGYEEATQAGDIDLITKYSEEITLLNAWDIEARIQEILGKLQIDNYNLTVKNLSGGQRKRVSLAKALIQNPDFLILDEPTNHLDIQMIEWLEEYLSKANLTLLLVTHDRYFLDSVCNHILELDQGTLYKHKGNYTYYLEKKALRESINASEQEKLKNSYRKELEWMRRQPKARTTKSKSRIDAFHEIKGRLNGNGGDNKLQLQINSQRTGSKIVELHNVGFKYPEKTILNQFSYTFKNGDKIGLVGPNGSGKTTLLNLITGKLSPQQGKIVLGETIKIGYYKQENINLKNEIRVIENVTEIAEFIPLEKGNKITAAQLLERFGFNRNQQYQLTSTLSGGERKRLYLATLLIENPNFLILDEPTNDLDIFTINALEDFLEQFAGCLIITSHDRQFLDKTTNQLFALSGTGEVKVFPGNYTEYIIYKEEIEREEKENIAKQKAALKEETSNKQKTGVKKLSFNEQRELQQLEQKIATLEQDIEKNTQLLNSAQGNEMVELSEKIGRLVKDLEKSTERWMELLEKEENLSKI